MYTIVHIDYKEGNGHRQAAIVGIIRDDDKIMSTKEKNLSLEDIFKDYTEEYDAEEFNWGLPVGREV